MDTVYINPKDQSLQYTDCEGCIKTDKTIEEVSVIPAEEIKSYIDDILEDNFGNGNYKGSF